MSDERTKVLFVDDEPRILNGLRRMLRPARSEWEMVFLDDGAAALEHLERAPVQVIVADLRMPHMDGVTLLTRVKQQHPDVVRIVLSGQPEMAHFLRTVGPAHCYLSKPCDPDRLRDTVRRATAVQRALGSAPLREIVAGMDSLPSRQTAIQQLLAELMSPDCSVRNVAAIVQSDVAMITRVMQVVNSPFFGLRAEVASPDKAVALLGLDTIRSLVLSMKVFSAFSGDGADEARVDALWGHSSTVGAYARAMARQAGLDEVAVGHTLLAGLLHDVGKLILLDQFPDRYRAVQDRAEQQGVEAWRLEETEFGASHAEIGGYLAGLWGFPHAVVEALVHHHRVSGLPAGDHDVVTLVHVADAFAHARGQDVDSASVDREHLERAGATDSLDGWWITCTTDGEEDP
jgi:putative nucleotidyltransferase with HDIG domain